MKYRLFFIIVILIWPSIVWSCECVTQSDKERFQEADAVFVGYLSEFPGKNDIISFENGGDTEFLLLKFRIIEAFKGPLGEKSIKLSLSAGTTCSAHVEKNINVLIFAFKNQHGVLEASKCTTFLAQKYISDKKSYGPTKQELQERLESLRGLMSNKSFESAPLALGPRYRSASQAYR